VNDLIRVEISERVRSSKAFWVALRMFVNSFCRFCARTLQGPGKLNAQKFIAAGQRSRVTGPFKIPVFAQATLPSQKRELHWIPFLILQQVRSPAWRFL
jgi:hypothetical protein